MKLTFNILSVRDFMNVANDWSSECFIENCCILKEELKAITFEEGTSVYVGCQKEIQHLIGFLRNILFFEQYRSYPATATDEEYEQIKSFFVKFGAIQ